MTPVSARPVAVEYVRGPLSLAAADALAALTAEGASATGALVQMVADGRLRLLGARGLTVGWRDVERVPLASTLTGIVVRTGEPLVITDVQQDPRVPADAPARRAGVGGYAGHPVRDGSGDVVGVCCVFDLRPRLWSAADLAAVAHAAQVCTAFVTAYRTGQAADRDRRLLDAVLDSLHDGVAACDATGRLVLVNSRMRRIQPALRTGLALTDPAARRGLHDPAGEPLSDGRLPLVLALRGERIDGQDVVVRRPGAADRVCRAHGRPIEGPGGERLGAVIAVRDVTEQRRSERFRTCELAVSTALAEAGSVEEAGPRVLQAVAGTLGWAHAELWLVDEASRTLRPAAHWTDPTRDVRMAVPTLLPHGHGLAGRAWQAAKPLWVRDIHHPQSLVSADCATGSGLRTALAVPLRNAHGVLGVLTVFADVVEDPADALVALLSGIAAHIAQFLQHRLVEELRREVARSRDEYLSLVSHELRTPVTSISACTGLLRDADPQTLAEHGPALLEVIDRNTTLLRQIIDELLELAALDTGHAALQPGRCDVAAVVRDAVAELRPRLAEGLTLHAELPDRLLLHGDAHRLRQVVNHLLGNAVKYSPDGGRITVRLRTVSGHAAELEVRDTGLGIPAEDRERVFARLYRGTLARERAIPGTGLGLTFSQVIVERHQGTITLAPDDGVGTRMVVRLPLAPP